MKTVFIYVLKCPFTDGILATRYAGKSTNPKKRFRAHLQRANDGCHRSNWIRSLLARGLKPIMEIVDEVPESEWQQWEVAYIEYFRQCGCDLVNGNAGGEGAHNPTPETRAKMSAAKTPEMRARLGERARTWVRTEETREKWRTAQSGKKMSDESRAKMRGPRLSITKEKHPGWGKPGPMLGKKQPLGGIIKSRMTRSINHLLKICQPLE